MDELERKINKKRLEARIQEFILRNMSHEVRKLEIIRENQNLDKEIEVNKKEIEKLQKELEAYKDIPT